MSATRIPRDIINQLASKFAILNRDDQKQDVVDQLGTNPVNHAEFIDQLNSITGGHGNIAHSYAYASYLDCTRYFQD